MAPKSNATKRAAAKAAAPPAKVQKQDPQASLLATVKEVISQADMPDSCKEMICAMLPYSLALPVDEREEVQQKAVAAVGEIMSEKLASMQAAIDSEAAKVTDVDAKKQEMESAIEGAQGHVTAAAEEKAAKEAALIAAQKVLDEKTVVLAEAKRAEAQGNADLEKAKADKEAMSSAYEGHFKPLRDEEQEEAQARAHLSVVSQSVGQMKVDASLLTTLPAACVKPKANRGSFDAMVFEELDKGFNAHIAALSETIAAATPAGQERTAAVEAAQTSLSEVKQKQEEAAEELKKAQSAHQETLVALTAAKKVLTDFMPAHKEATRARDEKVQTLKSFEDLNFACFVELRDRGLKKPEPVAAAAVEVGGA